MLDWLRQQRGTITGANPDAGEPGAAVAADQAALSATALPPVEGAPVADARDKAQVTAQGSRQTSGSAAAGLPLCLPHTDWLHHRLDVTGPAAALTDFQAAASGGGTIPWTLDRGRMAEDLFHLLVAPPAPQHRRLSLAGARMLTDQLCDAAERRHAAAMARVGHSRACPLDLHALVPVPAELLPLGPDHPESLAWLWAHWGTTQALRHVVQEPALALRTPLPAGIAALRLSFWSADWTPWRALAVVAAGWPTLRFDVVPTYGPL